MTECNATMQSEAIPDHTHTCSGLHDHQYVAHFCAECRRWWWQR